MFARSPCELSAEDIEKRLPLWCALSELFLDTELQPADFDRVAAAVVGAGVSADEARETLEKEVAPVFIANALSVAGEWAGWPEDFVRERIVAHLRSSAARRAWNALQARAHKEVYESAWAEVAYRLSHMAQSR
jgi:hypothetical protein